MKSVNRKKTLICGAIATSAFAVAVMAAPANAGTSDAWITTKAKLALMTTEGVDSTAINVDTVDRQITLHGTVSSAAEKQKAEATAKGIEGVSKVRDLLQVVAPARQAAVERRDEELSKDVTAALQREGALADSSITVQSVNKGVVLLAGNATTVSDHLTAVETAYDVTGVRRVASEIKSPETLADAEIWREGDATVRAPAPDRSSTVGDAARATGEAVKVAAKSTGGAVRDAAGATADAAGDIAITSMVKVRLLADKDTPAMDINVDTRKGNVTLFGIVPTTQAKAEAETQARKVSGVHGVKNELQVVADSKRPAVEAKDEELAASVETNLKSREAMKDVTIDVKNCVVRLTGTVPSGDQRVEALQVARATRGVCAVQNDLRFD